MISHSFRPSFGGTEDEDEDDDKDKDEDEEQKTSPFDNFPIILEFLSIVFLIFKFLAVTE